MFSTFQIQHNKPDAIVETQLNKFQQRTGCFVEYATVFGSSVRGYGIDGSDRDVGFVFDYPKPTTLTLKDNIKFNVGNVEFNGMSREFFLEKLGSSGVHHWLVFLADSSQFLIAKSEPYAKFRQAFMASRAMRDHIGRRFMQSGAGQLQTPEHNLGRAFGLHERMDALKANWVMFESDEEFCAAIKHHLQAIYTIALGLALATDQPILSNDITTLLGMTELGRKILPDVERLIRLRRSEIERENYSSKKGWALADWREQVFDYARKVPALMYEGERNTFPSTYLPQLDEEFNIFQGSDNTIRRTIVECFYEKG